MAEGDQIPHPHISMPIKPNMLYATLPQYANICDKTEVNLGCKVSAEDSNRVIQLSSFLCLLMQILRITRITTAFNKMNVFRNARIETTEIALA